MALTSSLEVLTRHVPTSLEALAPSLALLQEVLVQTDLPVWINADILAGPGGQAQPLDPQAFLSAVSALPAHVVLSLGWTTGWSAGTRNPGNHTVRGFLGPHLKKSCENQVEDQQSGQTSKLLRKNPKFSTQK